uniref:Vitelline membrane outer layer protein n=1 Tax=Callinectes arcuatus TaxID=257891 RepID=A0A7T1L7E1_CALAT|nr:vitelline membrane outer layer protein [Callinectes arcuatus]UST29541.1 vitelline membrane outer layer 1 [Callinectes toxotes]
MTALALLLPFLALGGVTNAGVPLPRGVAESLNLDNGLDRGKWGPIEVCSDGSYAFAFEIKYSGLGYLDDTSVNAIRMYCQTPEGALSNILISAEGSFGQWQGMRSCPIGEHMTSVRANVVPDQGTLGDDLGMDNLEMKCSGGKVLDGLYGEPHVGGKSPVVAREMTNIDGREMEAVFMYFQRSAHTRDYGDWGTWRACTSGKVCGLQVRLEDNHPLEDDAGITDAVIFCCT